jgi:hypothetical protein
MQAAVVATNTKENHMKKQLATVCISISLLGLLAVAVWSAQPTSKTPFRIEKAAALGASGVYVTTINKGAYQTPNSVQFQTLSKSFTSSAVSILDQSVSSGSASSVMTAASSGTMQMLYAYSTTIDGTLNIYNNTAGTGSAANSVTMTAGVPYEWDSITSGTTSLNLASTNSITFTAGTTTGGLPTSNTTTIVNAAAMYP